MKTTIMPSDMLRKQEILDGEVCDTIAALIVFGFRKDFYDCSCQTSEGKSVQVEKGYIDASGHGRECYYIRVWCPPEDDEGDEILALDITVQEDEITYVLSLKMQADEVSAKRRELERLDSSLASEEGDLENHINAAILALCDCAGE